MTFKWSVTHRLRRAACVLSPSLNHDALLKWTSTTEIAPHPLLILRSGSPGGYRRSIGGDGPPAGRAIDDAVGYDKRRETAPSRDGGRKIWRFVNGGYSYTAVRKSSNANRTQKYKAKMSVSDDIVVKTFWGRKNISLFFYPVNLWETNPQPREMNPRSLMMLPYFITWNFIFRHCRMQ